MNKAKQLYYDLVKAETIERNHIKLLVAIPKKKKKKFERLLANATAARLNALSAFQTAAKKLSPEKLEQLHKAVYL